MPDKLRGLPGLNRLSDEERQKFMLANADKLKQYSRPGDRKRAAEILYNNQQFINKFGEDTFNKMSDGSQDSYEARNNLLREKVVNDEWQRRYSPVNDKGKRNDNIGLGRDYEKYSQMSTDSKIKLLESEWKPINQIEEERRKSREEIVNPIRKWATKLYDWTIGEAVNEYRKGSNNKVLDRIYNEDAEKKGDDLAPIWNQARFNQDITGHNDAETKEMFKKAVTPGSYAGNIGIPEYAARLNSSEMSDFTIDDMRDILAKKAVYEQNMTPDQAATALNNEAKRYIKDHQSGWKKGLLFGKDLGISVLSYSMDKLNGIYNLGLMAADKTPGVFGDKPIVWVDDEGNVLHPSERQIVKKKDGTLGYNGEDGKFHSIHQEQIARTTLHNMGKNFDGSNISGWKGALDPRYWTRAEQFGTLDEQEQEQYEKLGASPYKVAYDPNEDTDLLYESFKMASFGIADAMSMFVGAGVGTAGRALSMAGKAGKVGKAAGEALQRTGKLLSNPAAQGMAGAGGIAYAYQRGAFQETLAKNLANADEAVFNASKQDIDNLYANNKDFKTKTDSQIGLRAASIKADMLNSIQQNGGEMPDEATLNAQALSRAREEILGELIQQRVQGRKASPEFARLQQEAINNAGDAAVNTFLPEAIKYGFVNTLGFRKFIFNPPTSLMNKAQKTFKGLEETAIKEGKNAGKKRLTVNSEFGSYGDKAKKFGKILGSQAWGGVWTNGTDDMMVDAAERVSDDAYSRYLNGYQKGEAIADVYGFADGVQSYFKGLMSSMGQETTWNAALVGGLGSIVSASPHLTNLAHLATKEGREAFRKEYGERAVRDENGFIKTDEEGRPITQKLSWLDNPGERLGFFIQNGVLNNYYGAMQNERTLQSHADFVNNLLDKYEDFNSIEDLITASKGYYNANSKGDTKTMQFIRAIESIRDLDMFGNEEDDPTILSSVIQDHKTLVDRASKIGEEGEDALSQEETDNLLRQYYANNVNIDRTETNDIEALQQIKKNAQKLQEAMQAYEEAGSDIAALEDNRGIKLDAGIKHSLMLNRALTRHWEDRIDTMRSELNDNSDINGEVSSEDLLSVVGGLTGAEAQIKIYDRQAQEFKDLIKAQKIHTTVKEKSLNKLQEQLDKEKDESKRYEIQKDVNEAEYDVEASKQQQKLFEDILSSTSEKSKKISEALAAQKKSGEPIRVLKADEIFALDPISRARMMKKENRHLYTKEQQREIEKLEKRLESTQGNTDAAEKIQDIATLIHRIRTNEDAYSRVANHPEAAARQEESLRREAAIRAYRIINKRNAETAANYLNDAGEKLRRRNVSDEEVGNYVYQVLRTLNSEILDNIDEDGLMPEYQEYLMNAKKWGKTLSDVTSVVQNLNWSAEDKQNTMNNISNIVSAASDQAGIMTELEKVLDSDNVDSNEKRKIEVLLKSLQQLGYQRDATVIESREKKKEREASQAERDEAARQRLQEDEQNAMNEAKAAQESSVQNQPDVENKSGEESSEEKQNVRYGANEDAIKQITLDDFLNITEAPPPPEEKRAEIKPEKMQAQMRQFVELTVDYLSGKVSAADYLESMNVNTDAMTREQVEKAAKEKANRYMSLIRKEKKVKAETSTGSKTETSPRPAKQMTRDEVVDKLREWYRFVKEHITFDRASHTYYIDGKPIDYSVSEYYESVFGKPNIRGDYSHSTAIGNSVDAINRDFFATDKDGKKKYNVADREYPNLNEERKKKIISDLERLEEWLDSYYGVDDAGNRQYKTITFEFPIAAEMKLPDGTKTIAGTIDMIIVDKDGNIHILDFKAKKGSIDAYNDRRNYTAQQNLYRAILETIMPESKGRVESLDLIWWETSYPKNSDATFKTDANGNVTISNGKENDVPISESKFFVTPYLKDNVTKSVISLDVTDKISTLTIPEMTPIKPVERKQAEDESNKVDYSNPSIQEVKVGELEGTVVTSETIEQQAQQQADEAKEDKAPVVTSEPLPMADDINSRGEDNNDSNPAFLSGNAMMEFVKKLFSAVGRFRRLEHRRGGEKHDSMNDFYAWLDATGTKMQNIIDDELPQILEKNPNIPIQFMVSKEGEVLPGTQEDPQGIKIDTHLMLVVEYTQEVKVVHEKYDNGGIFKSKGKEYLLVGVAGAGSFAKAENKPRKKEFQKLWNPYERGGRIFDERRVFFDKAENEKEQFFVPDNISTEIVPGSPIPGYIVHQLENDKAVEYRPISEVLGDKKRNPHGLTWDSLGWMIVENENHYFSNQEFADKAMGVRDTVSNVGNTFVLVPASNGKKISIAIEPRRYTEINDGKLKTRINKSLEVIGNPDATYEQKIDAVVDLTHWLYLDAEDNFILISKNNRVSLVRHVKDSQGGIREEMIWTRKLDEESYSFDDFLNAMNKLNPRINLHGMALENVEDLKAYDEAGALNINAAKLGTVGSNYSIFPVGADGKAKKPEGFKGYKPSGTGTVEGKMPRVFYRGVEYSKIDGVWKFGKTAVDESLAEELEYNLRAKSMSPTSESNGWSYYIMQEGEHPEVVKINTKQSYKVEKLSDAEAKEFIRKIQEEKKRKEREEAAKKELERRKEMEAEGFSNLETQVMYNPDTGEEIVINAETGEVIEIRQKEAKPEKKKEEKPATTQLEGTPKIWGQTAVQNFEKISKNRKIRGKVFEAVFKKWPEAPEDTKKLSDFLQKKGVGEPIGTSDEAVNAWIEDIKCHK